jgi:hypothetical protein
LELAALVGLTLHKVAPVVHLVITVWQNKALRQPNYQHQTIPAMVAMVQTTTTKTPVLEDQVLLLLGMRFN